MTRNLEAQLADLAAILGDGTAPDVVPAVMARLPGRPRRRRPVARGPLALALAVALLGAGTAMAVPITRNGILRALGLRGVRIERVPGLPALPAGAGVRLGLGARIPLARARHVADFTALLPPHPTAAYLDRGLPGARLSLLAGPDLVMEVRATVAPVIVKLAPPGTRARLLHVNGGPGVYLYGAPHEVFFETPGGGFVSDRVRLAGNVLIWQQGPLTIRIEGTLTLPRALALARSLR